jgi:hypothetical protein
VAGHVAGDVESGPGSGSPCCLWRCLQSLRCSLELFRRGHRRDLSPRAPSRESRITRSEIFRPPGDVDIVVPVVSCAGTVKGSVDPVGQHRESGPNYTRRGAMASMRTESGVSFAVPNAGLDRLRAMTGGASWGSRRLAGSRSGLVRLARSRSGLRRSIIIGAAGGQHEGQPNQDRRPRPGPLARKHEPHGSPFRWVLD